MTGVKLDDLAKELLKKIIVPSTDYFKTKIVIVPSIKMEAYLKAYFLKNSEDVLLNVQFLSFNKAILELFNADYKIADRAIIRSLIIKYLVNNSSKIAELKDYINISNESTYHINLYDVAEKIAEAFEAYDENLSDPTGYQKDIYKDVLDNLGDNLTTLRKLSELKEDKKIEAYLFGFTKYTSLQKAILSKFIIIDKFELEYKNEKIDTTKIENIVKAPSKLREIEALHSNICKKLESDHSLTLADFLVVSTNLSEYEVEINRVFNQEYKDYPTIPFFIDAPKMIVNATNDLLNMLVNIGNKGFFTRRDIIDILDNWIIRKIKNINDKDMDYFKESILDLRVYRKKSDWIYLKRRLLMSKISDMNEDNNLIELSGSNYKPFTTIGLSDKNISDLIEIINNLESIINLFKDKTVNIDNIKSELDKWLSIKEYGIEKNSYYNKMINLLDYWKTNSINAPINTLFYNLLDLTSQSKSNKGFLYTSGISFVKFNPNIILSAKYIYFIGASSVNLPLKKEKNPFDLINNINYDDEELAFKLYCLNATKNIYFSYVNKDLKENQEQYFLSSFVKKLYANKDDIKYYNMPLDEKRDYEDIYTKRAIENKEFREGLVSKPSIPKIPNNNPDIEFLKEVKTGDMAKFLNEPLSFKANKLFGNDDDTDDKLDDEYEPFTSNALDTSNIFVEMAINSLLDIDNSNLYAQLRMDNLLPNISEDIAKKIFNDIEKTVDAFVEKVKAIGTNYEIIRKNPIPKDPRIISSSDTIFGDWKLVNNIDIIRIIDENDEYIYIPIKEKPKEKDTLKAYIMALKDIVDKNETHKFFINHSKEFSGEIEPFKAKELLNNIYEAMNDYSDNNNIFFDFSLVFDEKFDEKKNGINQLYFGENGYWQYFDSKKLFDKYNQLGYTDNYTNEIEAMLDKITDLVELKEVK